MLSKAQIKYIQSLHHKKFRQKYDNFIAEGDKIVREILKNKDSHIKNALEAVYVTTDWSVRNADIVHLHRNIITEITPVELKKISTLNTPNQALIILKKLKFDETTEFIKQDFSLALDQIQDPGNMGTILRIADWFGIKQVFCSLDCVDIYNPKVIQATMGSFMRVKIIRDDLENIFNQYPDLPVLGAMLDGDNLFEKTLPKKGILLIGNEGKGVRASLQEKITQRIKIPAYGGAESLNAGVATGIICAMLRK